MRWPSRKNTKGPKAAETPEGAVVSKEAIREKWCQDVKVFCDVWQYTSAASLPLDSISVEALNRATADYLMAWDPSLVRHSPDCDAILGDLIDSHARLGLSAKEVAIVACLSALSVPAATKHVESLIGLDIERYLRCLSIAGQINSSVVSEEDLRSAQSLLRVLSGQGHYLEKFLQPIETTRAGDRPSVVPPIALTRELANCSGLPYLHSELSSCLEHRRFLSAFHLFSWLRSVLRNANNEELMTMMAVHFPSWPWMAAWRPNLERIGKWEHGEFTAEQCSKLSRVFDLDGPDIFTHQHETLKMAEPRCYDFVPVNTENTETLEILLNLLFRAHSVGPRAIDLFIHLCIDSRPDEAALSIVHDSLQTGDDSFCHRLSLLLLTPKSQSNLSHQMDNWTEALPILNDKIPEKIRHTMNLLASHLCDVFKAAQVQFCLQLKNGTGEHIGMRIYEFGKSILQASAIHSALPPEFLTQIRSFPPPDVLEAMFDQLQDSGEDSHSEDARFRSCLASILGGKSKTNREARSITLTQIQEEVQFWKHPPSSERRDLAKTIGTILATDYPLYTSCLLAMLKEHDIYVADMRSILSAEKEKAFFHFATYLGKRRGLQQMQHECWLLLLMSLIKRLEPSLLHTITDSEPVQESLKLIGALSHLLAPVQSQLPPSGAGLTQERLLWWQMLSLPENKKAVQLLVQKQGERGKLAWIYFPSAPDRINYLLQVLKQGQNMTTLDRQIMSYLTIDGRNVDIVCDCARAVMHTSSLGRMACERILSRKATSGLQSWSLDALATLLEAWRRTPGINRLDRLALDHIRILLSLSGSPQQHITGTQPTNERLLAQYDLLLEQAREMESLRLRVRHANPERISNLLSRLGVENGSSGRAADNQIPDDLIDAVESVGEFEYEVSFPLTGLKNLQRQSRGIPQEARILLIRLCLKGSPKFCLHFSPNDEGPSRHQHWETAGNRQHEPDYTICTTKPSLFSYYASRNLHRLLRMGHSSLSTIHSVTLALITSSPTICLVCPASISTRLWKPATCSSRCSTVFRKAPLEVRLHNLLVDPLAMDLLLTCVYVAAADPSTLDLLPGCPVPKARVAAVIDSFPPLVDLQNAPNLRAAVRGSGAYGKEREDLLSWLCTRFRGLMLNAQNSFRVPSMPGTQQFLLLNSSQERERLFEAQMGPPGSSGVVFHSTQVSRLFRIFTEGLKVMSNTPFMVNGASHGAGIYCADEQSVSLSYAGAIGQSWKNSALGSMRIMMGCELAMYAPSPMGYHVVADENRLLVRYIFLLPPTYRAPPRQHVEPAINITFANLRSGLLA
jgi:hypothetical protein